MQWNDERPTPEQAAHNGSTTEILLMWTPKIGTARTIDLLEEMGLL